MKTVYLLCWTEYFGCRNISVQILAKTAKSGITLRNMVRYAYIWGQKFLLQWIFSSRQVKHYYQG